VKVILVKRCESVGTRRYRSNHALLFSSKPLGSADSVLAAAGRKYSKELKSERSEKGEILEIEEEF